MNHDLIIGSNLKLYRERMELTQELLAEYLGISREEISYYENGKRSLPTKLMSKAAKLFGIDEYDLIESDNNTSKAKVALAFRTDTLNANDLKHIADFRKIVLNYLGMKNAITHESTGT